MNKVNVLTFVLFLVLLALGGAGYFWFAKSSDQSFQEQNSQAQVNSQTGNQADEYAGAPLERLEGISVVQQEHLIAVREYKEFIRDNPEGGPEVAHAFTRLNKEYYRFPNRTHFEEIFYGEPDLFSHLVAAPDAKPSQEEVSLLNLWKYMAENYDYSAEAEINIANEMVNQNPEIYAILSEYCAGLSIAVNETCDAPVNELLSAEQTAIFNQLVAEIPVHLENVDAAIPALEAAEDWDVLTRVYIKRTRVMHKIRLYGLTTPGEIMASAIKTTAYAEKAGDVEKQIDAQIDYALIVAQLLHGTDGHEETVASILGEIYRPDGKLNSRIGKYSIKMAKSYELVAAGTHTQGNHMDLLGATQLALVDPNYKHFLETNAGFDFNSPTMQSYVTQQSRYTE